MSSPQDWIAQLLFSICKDIEEEGSNTRERVLQKHDTCWWEWVQADKKQKPFFHVPNVAQI